MVLNLSKYGYGVWGGTSLSMDNILEDGGGDRHLEVARKPANDASATRDGQGRGRGRGQGLTRVCQWLCKYGNIYGRWFPSVSIGRIYGIFWPTLSDRAAARGQGTAGNELQPVAESGDDAPASRRLRSLRAGCQAITRGIEAADATNTGRAALEGPPDEIYATRRQMTAGNELETASGPDMSIHLAVGSGDDAPACLRLRSLRPGGQAITRGIGAADVTNAGGRHWTARRMAMTRPAARGRRATSW